MDCGHDSHHQAWTIVPQEVRFHVYERKGGPWWQLERDEHRRTVRTVRTHLLNAASGFQELPTDMLHHVALAATLSGTQDTQAGQVSQGGWYCRFRSVMMCYASFYCFLNDVPLIRSDQYPRNVFI